MGPRTIMVGATGHQGVEYLELLAQDIQLVGLVDINTADLERLAGTYGVPAFTSVRDALAEVDFELAIVAIPHYLHQTVTADLLRHGKHIIKEKPFATSVEDAVLLSRLAGENDVSIYTIVQRNYQESFVAAQADLPLIGRPYWFRYEYFMDLPIITTGWRAVRAMSCGGVVLDMGYHVLDMIVRFFGAPDRLSTEVSYCFDSMHKESLEDTANITLGYSDRNLQGSVLLSRHHYEKREQFEILGVEGALVITPRGYRVYSRAGELIKDYRSEKSKVQEKLSMFRTYLGNIGNKSFQLEHEQIHHCTVNLIKDIYRRRQQNQHALYASSYGFTPDSEKEGTAHVRHQV